MANLTSTLSVRLIDNVSKPARSVSQALKDAERAAVNVAKGMSNTGATDRFAASLSKLKLSAKDIEAVSLAWKDYSRSAGLASNSSSWTKTQAAGVRSWEAQTIASLRAVKREQAAFAAQTKASVAAAAAGAKSGGGGISMGGAVSGAVGLAKGILPMAGAYAAYEGVHKLGESGVSYQHAVTALRNVGLTVDEMKEAEEKAKEVSRAAPGTSTTDAINQIRETIGAFGSLEHSLEHATALAQINSVLKAAGREGVTSPENAQNFVRYFEERNIANNAERFQKEAKEQARAMAFFGEKYNPSEMLNFAQQAKSTLVGYNERFATKIAPSLVTMLGGERAGTAASMFDKTIMGRVQDKQQAAEWVRLGLLDPKQVIMKAGHPVSWKPGAVKNTEKAMRDPFAWVEEDLIPSMKKRGYNPDDILSMRKGLALLFRNTNANLFASDLSLPGSRKRLHKDEQLQNRMGTFDEIFQRNQAQDPTVAADNLKKAIETFGAAFTSSVPVAQWLNEAADAVRRLADALPAFVEGLKATKAGLEGMWGDVKRSAGDFIDNSPLRAGERAAAEEAAKEGRKPTVGEVGRRTWDEIKKSWTPNKSFNDTFDKYRKNPVSPIVKTSGAMLSEQDLEALEKGGGFNTRGVRNMNMGNIAYGPWAVAHGAVAGAGTDSGHKVAVFPSHEAGAAAADALALGKYHGGKRSIDQLIAGPNGWTPGNHAAAANIARSAGMSPFEDARLDDPERLRRFRNGLMDQELGPRGGAYVRKKLAHVEEMRKSISGGPSLGEHDADMARSYAPEIDTSSIDVAHRKLRAFRDDLRDVHQRSYRSPVPGLGKIQRGNFSFGGVQGE